MARKYYEALKASQRVRLTQTVLLGLPGSLEAYTLGELRIALNGYNEIGEVELRENLRTFIREIVLIATESGVLMALHPEDPPWSLLSLPRVVCNQPDIEQVLAVADSPSNGITMCTGSFGASAKNDVADMAERLAKRINFIHLRNVTTNENGDFIEDNHLDGDVDMYRVMKPLLIEQRRRVDEGERGQRMPFRPDHGHLMSPDRHRQGIYPGYSLFGRMRGLAELRGMELGIRRSLGL